MSRLLRRASAGLAPQPWPGPPTVTGDLRRVVSVVDAAVTARALVSVVGPRGSGKSVAVREALRGLDCAVVEPVRLDRDRLHLGDIAAAIVADLSEERPRRSGEARSRQVRRILGAASRRRPVALAVDDAHRLHYRTAVGLKRLLELAWMGRAPLLAIVLVGQSDRAAAIPEVGRRADRVVLAGLSGAEAREAASRAMRPSADAPLIGDAALERLVADPRSRNWLDLADLLDRSLAASRAREGAIRISAADVRLALGDAPAAPAAPSGAPPEAAVAEALRQRRERRTAAA
ncbi:MAG: AAA family ATPase [Rhodospirillales bacterium]|nr:AAA family ATPase [Rhodospirillales bacterium]